MVYTSEFPIIDVTVDAVIVSDGPNEADPHVVLIRRGQEPFKGCLALPGGFMDLDENAQEAALREAREEVGLEEDFVDGIFPLPPMTDPERDPRMRIISLPFLILASDVAHLQAGDDAAEVEILTISEALKSDLAFDHKDILRKVVLALAVATTS